MKIKLFFFLLAASIYGVAFPLSYEQVHHRAGTLKQIPDLGFISYTIEEFSLSSIESIELSIVIKHKRASDLLITITSPDNNYISLHNMSATDGDTLIIDVTGEDLLVPFIGFSSIGRWEVQFYDQVKGVSGVIQEISMTVNGGDIDRSVNRPMPIVTGALCGEKWDEILLQVSYETFYKDLIGNCGEQLKKKIKALIDNHRSMSYDSARGFMFSRIDNYDGKVCSVYSDRCLSTKGMPPNHIMNCEHSWPQSKGAVGDAKSDLHHLFPAGSKVNSDRSSHPFCEIEGERESNMSKLGQRDGRICFEPRDGHKGDLARAMMYFAVRYGKKINTFQEMFFRKWNQEDRVSFKEIDRNNAIENYQGNRNPFVDHPELIKLISEF